MQKRMSDVLRERGVTQQQVADALGLSQAAVSRRLAGRAAWKVREVAQLAVLLDASPADVWHIVAEEAA